jgi:predicted permease
LGKSIRTDGIDRTIVGVLPPNFRFLSFSAPIYMPLSSEEGERNVFARHNVGLDLIGRIAPGATIADVRAQIAANDAAHAPEFPQAKIVADAGCYTVVAPLHADHVKAVRPLLLLLQGGALCLFLIGGVNLANLLLIRASGRSRELAIRQALGANQGHVIREVLTETTVLTVAGALLGLLVGAFGVDLLSALGASQLPLGAEITFNSRIVFIALVAALISGVLLGLPIVWFNLRSRLAVALQSESRGSTVSRATQRLRHGFIVAQIALAFVLLAGAGLLGLSLKRAMAVSPGFRADHVITGQFTLTWKGYHTEESFPAFFNRLYEKTRSIPGVAALGVVSTAPMVGGSDNNGPMTVPGHKSKPGEDVVIHNRFGVAGDYFAAMGISLREGRYLTQADSSRKELVCVVDENFAHLYWPEGGAVGKIVYRGSEITADNPPYTLVGVVGAVKQAGLTEATPPGSVYFPYSQIFMRNYYLAARTTLPPESLGLTLKKIIREIDPDVPLTDLRSMEARIDESLATRRAPALLAGIFAFTALLLATIGLYGVMAYTVAQRTSEFGIRMALGAQRGDVLRMVFGQGALLSLIGLGIGVLGTLFFTNFMTNFLFGVKADDPFAFAGVALLLATVAALASYLPARRATKVDPMIALRAE